EFVRPMTDIVVAVDVDVLSADGARLRCLFQVKLAVAEIDLVIVAEILIDSQRPGILAAGGGDGNKYVCALLDGRVALGDDRLVKERDRTEPAARNAVDVAAAIGRIGLVVLLGKGLPGVLAVDQLRGGRIVNRNYIAVLIRKRTEVAIAHRVRWSGPSGFRFIGVPVAFPRQEKEGAVLTVVKLWNLERTADRCAKLVLPQGSQVFLKVAGGVHAGIAQELPKIAMVLVGTAFRNHAHHGSGGPAVLRQIVVTLALELLDAIDDRRIVVGPGKGV